MQREFWKDTGHVLRDSAMSPSSADAAGTVNQKTTRATSGVPDAMPNSVSVSALEPTNLSTNTECQTSLSVETHVRKTATHDEHTQQRSRVSALSSSAFLMNFARACFFEKTRPQSVPMLPGLGGDFDKPPSRLAMLCCPSDSGRVALALTTGETGCSCLVKWRTPIKRDWKGCTSKKRRERERGDNTPNLPDQLGGVPHPEFVEELMGFPIRWSDLADLETPSMLVSENGSDEP